jgi:hypothetical protein
MAAFAAALRINLIGAALTSACGAAGIEGDRRNVLIANIRTPAHGFCRRHARGFWRWR